MPEVTAAHLNNDQIDALLERFDATDPALQRRIVVQLSANLYKAEKHREGLLAAALLFVRRGFDPAEAFAAMRAAIIEAIGEDGYKAMDGLPPLPRDRVKDAAPALLAACKGMLPMLQHLEQCEASADDGLGDRLRALRRSLSAARAAIRLAENSADCP